MESFIEYILEMKIPDEKSDKGLSRVFSPTRVKRLKKAMKVRKSMFRQMDVQRRSDPNTLAKWAIPTWKERGDLLK